MSRAAKQEVEKKLEAERAVAQAERVLDHATEAMTGHRIRYRDADELWIRDGSKRAREARSEASDNLERAEILHQRAGEEVEAKRASLQAIIVEEKSADLETMRAELARFAKTIGQHGDAFVEIDRHVEVLVMAVATELRQALEVYDAASAVAAELHVPPECGIRPDLANVSLEIRRLVTAARAAENRDALAPHWLSQVSSDWRTRELDAQNMSFIDRNARIERDRRIAETAAADAFAAGRAAGITTTETA